MRRSYCVSLTLVALAVLLLAGCATKKYVQQEVGAAEGRADERMGDIQTQVEANQTRLDEHEGDIAGASKTAQDALNRAIEAGKLAEGKFLYEVVLSDDKVRFGFDKAELTDEAKLALDAFAAPLNQENRNVYIEIQGHTDSIGSDDYNLKLGERRAEVVRRYLSAAHGIALHRMAVISYGESEPVTENDTREGRAQNRRVVLVVLQ